MDMELSLKEFKEKLYNNLLEIHWKQWTTLGVSSHVGPEKGWGIDLEPLIVSTFAIGLYDRRLLSCCIEWLIKNGEWLNISRLKRISKIFAKPLSESMAPLIAPEIPELIPQFINRFARTKVKSKKSDLSTMEGSMVKEYEPVFRAFKVRGVVTEPRLQNVSLVQLLLRSVFGIDARTEILIYLLVHEAGNSNSISKEVFYNQRNVYTILERWAQAQMVTKISEGKATRYSLRRKNELLQALGLKRIPKYVNWTTTFQLVDELSKALSTPPWSEDEYLLSSLFRDQANRVKFIGSSLKIEVPEPTSQPGRQYFAPFGTAVLTILETLKKGT
jgi:hypothetical protein